MLLPVDHTTVTVLGSIWKPSAPWSGLKFEQAIVRRQNTLALALFGPGEAWPDYHLDVPFIHPEDEASGWAELGECMYRVRPRPQPGKRWKGRKVRSVEFIRQDAGWALDVQFASDPLRQ